MFLRINFKSISMELINLCVSQFGFVTVGPSLRSVRCDIVMQFEDNFLQGPVINLHLVNFQKSEEIAGFGINID